MHQQPGFPSQASHQHNVMAAALAQNPSMILPPPMQQSYVLPSGAPVQMATSVSNSLLGNPMSPNMTSSANDATGKLMNMIAQNQMSSAHRRPLSVHPMDDEEKPKKVSKKAKSRKKPPQNLDPNRPKRATPLTKPMRLSPDLMAVVGAAELGRAQVVKAIWGYIRQYNLQDPNDKRYFTTDDKLRAIFNGLERLNCFEMNKYLSAHLSRIESDSVTSTRSPASVTSSTSTSKNIISSTVESTPIPNTANNTTNANTSDIQNSGLSTNSMYHPLSPTTPDDLLGSISRSDWELVKPMRLSPELMAIVGVAELSRSQVVKAIWNYIRQYNLQDQNDRRYFNTDEKLRVIFNGADRMSCFEINQYLTPHLTETEPDPSNVNSINSGLASGDGSNPTDIDVAAAAVAAVAGLQGTTITSGHSQHLLNLASSADPLTSAAAVANTSDLHTVASAVGLPPTPISELKSE
jgi:chromatin remodeling complex protein RSC6